MDKQTYAVLKKKIDNVTENIDEVATQATESWLEENVDPDTGYVLDRTLSMSNAAAPADLVGEQSAKIEEVKTAIGYEGQLPVNLNKSIAINNAVVLPSNIATENGFCCICVPCQEGDVFTVTGKGGNTTQLWGFSNSTGTVLSQSGAGKEETDLKLIAPENASYFAFNSYTNVTYCVIKGVTPLERFDEVGNEIGELKTILEDHCGYEAVSFTNQSGKKYITSTGNINSASGTFHVTEPIPVTKNTEVHFVARGNSSDFTMIATCASDGTSVAPKVGTKGAVTYDYVYTTTEDGYIILSYNYSYSVELYFLSNIANEVLRKDVDLNNTEIVNINARITNNGNLINQRKLINGKVVNQDGTLSDNSGYATTSEIKVKPSTKYSYRGLFRIVQYKEDGTWINHASSLPSTGTITTNASCGYVVISVAKDATQVGVVYADYKWQFVEGETLPDYAPQIVSVDGFDIVDDNPSFYSATSIFRQWDKICFDKTPVTLAAVESDAVAPADKTVSAIIAKYDALMGANEDYITKTALGTSSDDTTIYQYDFVTPDVPNAGVYPISTKIKPKIILISGVHPEFGGIYGLYNAMREITNNPNLADIKFGVHFIVIPTVNTYGINNSLRKNANGVDIARNFEVDFSAGSDPTSQTYASTEPLDQPESQIVNTVMANNTDAIVFASCHSFQLGEDNRAIWGSCATRYMTNIVGKLIDKMSMAWRNKYTSEIPQTIDTLLGSVGLSTETGSEGKQGTKYGIQGLTLETCDAFGYDSSTALTSFAISRNSETYINFIKTVLGCWESSDPKDMYKMCLY